MNVAFVGDVMLDAGPGRIITNGGNPFSGVAAVTINLECAIVKESRPLD